MKKGLVLLSVLATAVALSACGNNNSGSNAGETNTAATDTNTAATDTNTGAANNELSGTIKVLLHRTDLINDGTMDKYAAKFKEKYPNANVEFEGLTNYASDITVRLTTGEAGDVNMISTGIPVSELPKYYAPLPDDMFNNVYFKDYMAVGGKRYGIVTGVNTQGIVYNKKAFAAAGIDKAPATLDELYADAQKLKDKGIVPLYMNYGAQWPMGSWGENTYTYISGNAKWTDTLIKEDAPFKVDGPWGEILNIGRKFVENGWVEKDLSTNNWEMSKGEVASGKAAMLFLGNWVIPQLVGAGAASEDIGFVPFPYDNTGKYNAPLGGDYYIGVSKDSKNIPLATAWVNFFVKESGYDTDSGFMPIDQTVEPKVTQMAEFKGTNPTFIPSEATDPKFLEIANKAEISLGTGAVDQELIVAKDLQKAFNDLNAKWAKAKKELGY
ncbi:ABC transporter substrate-binding protein [Paenibacillus sp. OV219]|uniref:ABC transporter substrate-binding protein n=1 Tax=Paenibacillus sp. OV219 TaxID=1884377 RepID=UPI0008AC1251|nr:extracellular solute-binding protein [Paenibacillus sp. OV219]SEM53404.1 ABC-type glycerol-3-phosphate transport system, substrate-binding protein [Paenibacillus sp. OV219]